MTTINELKNDSDDFCSIETSDEILMRGKQKFVAFGDTLYDISAPFTWEYRGWKSRAEPELVEGKYVMQYPDEGRSGMLCTITCKKPNGAVEVYSDFMGVFGWILRDELNASNREIAEHTADMYNAGALPLPGCIRCG